MSNAYSEQIAWVIGEFRHELGNIALYQGNPFSVITEPVSGAQCGVEGLPKEIKDNLGIYIADLDPRVFRMNPLEFAPTTGKFVPVRETQLFWYDLTWQITRVNYDDTAGDTHAISVYCVKKIW